VGGGVSDIALCRDCGGSGHECSRCSRTGIDVMTPDEARAEITRRVYERMQEHLRARCLTYTIDRTQPVFTTTVIIGTVEPRR
jgi:hypothetical protein